MQLNDVLTESELNEINLGKVVGGVAKGVGAVAGGAMGAWDAAKKGFSQGRTAVSSQGDDEEVEKVKQNYKNAFSKARSAVSTDDPVETAIELISKLTPEEKSQVLAALGQPAPDMVSKTKVKKMPGKSSTGGTMYQTNKGVIHRAKRDGVTEAELDEALKISPEEVDLYKAEIKNLNTIIQLLNGIYNKYKAAGDTESMNSIKARLVNKSMEREGLIKQLEQRLTGDAFNKLKEEIGM